MNEFKWDVGVIGGGGHVGLPLAMTFADVGLRTAIYDINADTVARIGRGEMPFSEEGGQEMLARVRASGNLTAFATPDCIRDCRIVVMVVGTPVDEHLNPSLGLMQRCVDGCREYLHDGQVLILRSTVFPGTTRHIQQQLQDDGLKVGVAFCPERVAQGFSLREFRELPQIISAFDDTTLAVVRDLFAKFVVECIEMEPMEAELCKLMTNAWRYIQFATVNQFYMIATSRGLSFDRILHGCRHRYPRMAGVPGPGFAAGPCLMKDTMQLAAFCHNQFILGHSAMLINEGLPAHLIDMARRQRDLSNTTCGILGMAFKGNSDDIRDSLSYKLRKLLRLECKRVLCSDPRVEDPSFLSLDHVIAGSDIIFVGAPHSEYRRLHISADKVVVDVWGCIAR